MRFACARVPFFAAAAAERAEPTLREHALAVVVGAPPGTRVAEANATAREYGVLPGMTESEARARCATLVTRAAGAEADTSARAALLDAALGVSPRVEDGGAGIVHVDVRGLERLVGDDAAIAARLARAAHAVGLPARVGVASTRTIARMATWRERARLTVIAPADEAAWLARAPLDALELEPALAATFGTWGIRTVGELGALPRSGLAMRLGEAGLQAHDHAHGCDRTPFRAYAPPPFWEEALGLDWELESLDALARVLGVVLDRLCARLRAAAVAADALTLELALVSGARHERTIALAYPLQDPAPLLTLVTLDLEAHPPAVAITRVAVSAHAVTARASQARLWHPPAPALRHLAGAVARLARLVGPDNVGSPLLTDSHRPDAFTLQSFQPSHGEEIREPSWSEPRETSSRPDVGATPDREQPARAQLALRRLRPPRRVEVETVDDRPVRVVWGGWRRIVQSAGPWRVSGEWWEEPWARDEWDVACGDGTLCRLARDRVTGAWWLDAVYD
ncbi:MAG TPA: DNA polymerase Y family protein [Methylomirabilota bacterium]